jgi:hypothetical protein
MGWQRLWLWCCGGRAAEHQTEAGQLRTANKGLQQKVSELQAIAARAMDTQRQLRRGSGSNVADDGAAGREQAQAVRLGLASMCLCLFAFVLMDVHDLCLFVCLFACVCVCNDGRS